MKKIRIFLGLLLLIGVFFSCNHKIEVVAKYTVTYQSEYGTVPSSIVVNDKTALTQEQLPILEEEGYVFDGWYIGYTKIEAGYKVNSNITLVAQWNPNTDTIYKVAHYQQNIKNDEYTLVETEEKAGTTGAQTQATAKEYEGFVAKEVEQETILANGSAEVKVYYDRKVITLTFDSDGGTAVESIIGKYGATITAPENPTKEGYSFVEWIPEIPSNIPSEDTTYKVLWEENSIGIIVQAPVQSDIPNLEKPIISGTTVTFEVPEEYVSYSWHIDGVLQDNENAQIFILDTTNLSAKSYYIMLVVTDENNNVYSAQYELEVTK